MVPSILLLLLFWFNPCRRSVISRSKSTTATLHYYCNLHCMNVLLSTGNTPRRLYPNRAYLYRKSCLQLNYLILKSRVVHVLFLKLICLSQRVPLFRKVEQSKLENRRCIPKNFLIFTIESFCPERQSNPRSLPRRILSHEQNTQRQKNNWSTPLKCPHPLRLPFNIV